MAAVAVSGVPAHPAGSRPGGRLEALLLLERQLEFLSDARQSTDSIWAFLADPAEALGVHMTLEPTVPLDPMTPAASSDITAAAVAELFVMSDWRRTGVPTDWITYIFYTTEQGNEVPHVEAWIADIIVRGEAPLRVVETGTAEDKPGSVGNAFVSVASAGNVALAAYMANKYPEDVRKPNVLYSSLRTAAEHGRDPAIIPLLLRLGAQIRSNSTVIMLAARSGRVPMMRALLDAGANIHALNDAALLAAIKTRNEVMVAALLAAGADPNAHSMMAAVNDNQPNIVRQLIAAGANDRAEYEDGLRRAAESGNTEIVRILLDAGTDVHALEEGALRAAAYHNHLDIVKILLNAGADPRAHLNAAVSAAMNAGNNEVADYLRRWMAEHPPGMAYGANVKRQKTASKLPVLHW